MDSTLYKVYQSPEGLERKVRKTLRQKARQLSAGEEEDSCPGQTGGDGDSGPAPEEELETEGIYDLMEEGNRQLSAANEQVETMTGEIQRLGDRVGEEAAKLASGNPSAKDVKSSLNRVSETFDGFVQNVDPVLAEARDNFEGSMESYDRAIELIEEDFDPEDVQGELTEPRNHLSTLVESMEFSLENISTLRRTTENLPRLTSEFTRSRNQLVKSLNGIEGFLGSGITEARSVLGRIDGVLGDG